MREDDFRSSRATRRELRGWEPTYERRSRNLPAPPKAKGDNPVGRGRGDGTTNLTRPSTSGRRWGKADVGSKPYAYKTWVSGQRGTKPP